MRSRQTNRDGEFHRFATGPTGRDDAGCYVLHGDEFSSGTFGDWRTGAKFSWFATDFRELSPEEQQRLQQLEKERAEKIAAAHERAAETARQLWSTT
jgi:phage/plasmid primase-like uncharacterized protein